MSELTLFKLVVCFMWQEDRNVCIHHIQNCYINMSKDNQNMYLLTIKSNAINKIKQHNEQRYHFCKMYLVNYQ